MPNLDEICDWLDKPRDTPPADLSEECQKRISEAGELFRKTASKTAKKGIERRVERLRESLAAIQKRVDSRKADELLEQLEAAIEARRSALIEHLHQKLARLPKASFTEEQRDQAGLLEAHARDFGAGIRPIDFYSADSPAIPPPASQVIQPVLPRPAPATPASPEPPPSPVQEISPTVKLELPTQPLEFSPVILPSAPLPPPVAADLPPATAPPEPSPSIQPALLQATPVIPPPVMPPPVAVSLPPPQVSPRTIPAPPVQSPAPLPKEPTPSPILEPSTSPPKPVRPEAAAQTKIPRIVLNQSELGLLRNLLANKPSTPSAPSNAAPASSPPVTPTPSLPAPIADKAAAVELEQVRRSFINLCRRRLSSAAQSTTQAENENDPVTSVAGAESGLAGVEKTTPSFRPARVLAFLTGVTVLIFFGNGLVTGEHDYARLRWSQFDEASLWWIVNSFFLSFLAGAPVFGYLGDRVPRHLLLMFGLLAWGLALASTGVADNFGKLMATRVLAGLGTAVCVIISPGLIVDFYGPAQRVKALALLAAAIPFGLMLNTSFPREIHNPFAGLIMGGLGLFLALPLMRFSGPRRGQADERELASASAPVPPVTRLGHFGFALLLLGVFAYGLALTAIATCGQAVAEARYLLAPSDPRDLFLFAFSVLAIAGTLAGGLAASQWRKRNASAFPWSVGLWAVLATPFLELAALSDLLLLIKAGLVAAVFFMFWCVGPAQTLLIEAVPVRLRCRALAAMVILFGLSNFFGGFLRLQDFASAVEFLQLVVVFLLLAAGLWLVTAAKMRTKHVS